jgi:hypothetical protein
MSLAIFANLSIFLATVAFVVCAIKCDTYDSDQYITGGGNEIFFSPQNSAKLHLSPSVTNRGFVGPRCKLIIISTQNDDAAESCNCPFHQIVCHLDVYVIPRVSPRVAHLGWAFSISQSRVTMLVNCDFRCSRCQGVNGLKRLP